MDPAQTYVERIPVPALADRVRSVWVQHTGPRPYLQRNLPTGGVELHCPLGGLPWLVGPLTAADVQVVPAHTTVVGVRFWPGAAAALLGVPAGELVDLAMHADHLGEARQRGSRSCSPLRQGRTSPSSGSSATSCAVRRGPTASGRTTPGTGSSTSSVTRVVT